MRTKSPATSNAPETSARERILAVAYDLFYRQGYHATGINQIIDEAGVAKATLYQHFPSKDHLWLAYAKLRHRRELDEFVEEVEKFPTPLERFRAPLVVLIPWFKGTQYRGCPFQNLLAEVPSEGHAVQLEARAHKDSLRKLFTRLATELRDSSPEYSSLDPESVGLTYQLIFEGAIAAAVTYQKLWPVDAALGALDRLLAK